MPASIVLPYVDGMLSGNTLRIVKLSGYHYCLVQLDRNDLGAYSRLIRRLWRFPANIVIVEHDVEPTIGQLHEIANCGHDWCGFNYDDGLYPDGPQFGCVRFGARIMRRHPYAADDRLIIGKRKDRDAPWWDADSRMAVGLQIRGEAWQPHASRVHHAHSGPPSGPPPGYR